MAVITAENIPRVRNTRHVSFWRHKGRSTKHGKILESDYNISCDDSIAEETAIMDEEAEKYKRDSGVHVSMDSSSQDSSAKSDQSIRSGSASSQDSTRSSSRKTRILNKFRF